MNSFKILGLFLALFFLSASAQAQIENVIVTKVLFNDRVEFTLTNTGFEPLAISYVIIQDEVLMLTGGELELLPYSSEIIIVSREGNTSGDYQIQLKKAGQASVSYCSQ